MLSIRSRTVVRGSLLASLGVTAALSLAAAPADAAFSVARCGGTDVRAQGASFANSAQAAWETGFSGEQGCGGAPKVLRYASNGSGNGRGSLGAASGSTSGSTPLFCISTAACTAGDAATPGFRDPETRFAGTDEGPDPAQRNTMQTGLVANANDQGVLRNIPIGFGSTVVYFNLPAGCTGFDPANTADFTGTGAASPAGTGDAISNLTRRPLIPNSRIEAAFRGSITTWNQLIPAGLVGPNDATCQQHPILRVVRQDTSGTTFGFKKYLGLVSGAYTGWTTGAGGLSNGQARWPLPSDSSTGVAPDAVAASGCTLAASPNRLCSFTSSNAQNQANVVAGSPGTIGYGDLATVRTAGFTVTPSASTQDKTMWVPLQNVAGTAYFEPTSSASAHTTTDPGRGANCSNASVANRPTATGADATLGDWSTTFAAGGASYPACVLTYVMAWDDNATVYGTSLLEQQKARTVKDYLEFIVSAGGQALLSPGDYAPLSAETGGRLLSEARAAVAAIGWNKSADTGGGTPPPSGGTDNPPPSAPPTGGGNPAPPAVAPPVVVTPPPAAPSNAVSVSSTKVSKTQLVFNLRVGAAGVLRATSTYKSGRRNVSAGSSTARPRAAGTVKVTIKLSSALKRQLAKRGTQRVKVSVKLVFTPTGGTARTVNRSVTVRG